jgi:peroxiredoxin
MAQKNNSDEAKNVLRLSREKCQSIQQGHYVMERKMKFMSDKDTTAERHTCDFRKLPDDTIYGKAFNMLFEPLDEKANWKGHILYTGHEKVWISDTAAVIQSCDQWADKIIAGRHNQKFYTALTNKSCYPIPDEEHLADSSYSYSLWDAELDGRPCHLARYRKTDYEPDTVYGINTLLYEVCIWIDKRDYLPIQYNVFFLNEEKSDTMTQFEVCRLLEFSPKVDKLKLTMKSIPANLPRRDYVPYTPPEPLAEGTPAPDWALPTLAGDTVRLADLRGKVVLLDFFYKHCAPCCAALPFLQNLHKKYKDQGVVLLGVDPIDDPAKDEMTDFLAKRGITYTVLFSERQLSETYRIVAYPILFFIDRDGKIAKVQRGYHPSLEEAIEEQLQKML